MAKCTSPPARVGLQDDWTATVVCQRKPEYASHRAENKGKRKAGLEASIPALPYSSDIALGDRHMACHS